MSVQTYGPKLRSCEFRPASDFDVTGELPAVDLQTPAGDKIYVKC